MNDPEYLESLLSPLRASFHAKRRDRVGIAEQLARGVDAYVKAVDVEVTRALCKAHGLPAPPAGDPPTTLAAELLRLVQLLPELQAPKEQGPLGSAPSPATYSKHSSDAPSTEKRSKRSLATIAGVAATQTDWQPLAKRLAGLPLIVIGGPPHPERLGVLPQALLEKIEWIDTTRQGTHAIGNLERRIRDRRIGALLILEGLVQHRHSDPLTSAARSCDVVCAFGGKGGKAALQQALTEIDSKLSHRKGSE